MKSRHIIIGVTGSIAAYRVCGIISALKKKGYGVTCVMTEESEEFITPLTLETLSENKVYKDMFQLPDKREVAHVSLAEKGDLILISPATANIIGKLAAGICDDLLTCTVISSASPVVIVPAMNDRMYRHKIVQKNIRELKTLGYKFIGPVRGHLACGSRGIGHIAETDHIIKTIEKILK